MKPYYFTNQTTMKAFTFFYSNSHFWIRIFWKGFYIVDREKNPPLFSVRNEYRKEYRIGKYGFGFLS